MQRRFKVGTWAAFVNCPPLCAPKSAPQLPGPFQKSAQLRLSSPPGASERRGGPRSSRRLSFTVQVPHSPAARPRPSAIGSQAELESIERPSPSWQRVSARPRTEPIPHGRGDKFTRMHGKFERACVPLGVGPRHQRQPSLRRTRGNGRGPRLAPTAKCEAGIRLFRPRDGLLLTRFVCQSESNVPGLNHSTHFGHRRRALQDATIGSHALLLCE